MKDGTATNNLNYVYNPVANVIIQIQNVTTSIISAITTGNVTLANVGNSFVINGVNFKITNSVGPSAVVSASLVNLAINISGASNNSAAGVAVALSAAIQQAKDDPLTAAALSGLVVSNSGSSVLVTDVNPGPSSTTISVIGTNASLPMPLQVGRAAVSAQVAHNHGNLTLSSSSPNGISVGGTMPDAVGLSTGTTNPAQSSSVIGIDTTNTLTIANAQNAIRAMDSAISQVGEARGALGAYMNRLEHVVEGIQDGVGNSSMARSRILDADFASESAAWIRSSILCNASLAMVAQANTAPHMALALLKSL
jgi:flagellin